MTGGHWVPSKKVIIKVKGMRGVAAKGASQTFALTCAFVISWVGADDCHPHS